jgi:MFS family permease
MSVRIADFFQQAALQAYMYYQLKSFDPDAPDTEISFQAGVLLGVFTAAQIFTGIAWGRIADSSTLWCGGRKRVMMLGLLGQGCACVGVAFSRSFRAAVIWRGLGGASNATVGGARTALSEATPKRYHSRTFLILPLAWNIANILGPMVGGGLADLGARYAGWFGGVRWMREYPYALPNLFSAVVCWADALLLFFWLRETLVGRQERRDLGLEIGERVSRGWRVCLRRRRTGYSRVGQDDVDAEVPLSTSGIVDGEEPASTSLAALSVKDETETQGQALLVRVDAPPPASFYDTLTRNVFCVLLTVAFLDFQMGGFTSLWTVTLSSSRRTPAENKAISIPFHFAGGLAMSPATIGVAMSSLGFAGILFQLTVYPRAIARFGLLRSLRVALFVYPLAYAIAPYLSLLVDHRLLLWVGIVLVASLQVGARTFAAPGVVLLTNNASPSPAVLGTIHGMGAATSSMFRTVGPIVVGHWYSQGLEEGVVGKAWWLLSLVALIGVVPSYWARDGR